MNSRRRVNSTVGFLTLKMRKAVLIFSVLTFLLVVHVEASACSCDADPPTATMEQLVAQALSGAQAVFAGKVVAIDKRTRPVRVVFMVDRSWKGNVPRKVVISTGRGDGDCGYPFLIGRRYVVYAGPASLTRWGTSICHRTGNVTDRGDDLRVLGDPKRSFKQRRSVR